MHRNERTVTTSTIEIHLPDQSLVVAGHNASWFLADANRTRAEYGCRQGDVAIEQRVTVTAAHWEEREYRYGYTGQWVERRQETARETVEIAQYGFRRRNGTSNWIEEA